MPEEQNNTPTDSQDNSNSSSSEQSEQQQPENQQQDTVVSQALPTSEPAATTQASTPKQSGTVLLVWQWLTYGLWTWTLGALSVLISSTILYFIVSDARNNDYTWLIYIIATTLCLLPISYLIDRTYSKNEPAHKQGFAAVILVIHAVFAFLVSIGALITAVVTLLSLATDVSGDSATKLTVIASALIIALLGGLFFARIVQPAKFAKVSRRFGLIVSVVATVTVIAALAGPYFATIQTRQDRQIEEGLYSLSASIQSYASNNQKLPATLGDLKFESYDNTAKQLAKSGLVRYTQKSDSSSAAYSYNRNLLKYELCVTYKKAKGTGEVPKNTYDATSAADNSYSSSYISTSSHPAGKTCYQQTAYITVSINYDETNKPTTVETQ